MDMLHPLLPWGKDRSAPKESHHRINTDSLRRTKTHAASGNLGLESLMTADAKKWGADLIFFQHSV